MKDYGPATKTSLKGFELIKGLGLSGLGLRLQRPVYRSYHESGFRVQGLALGSETAF